MRFRLDFSTSHNSPKCFRAMFYTTFGRVMVNYHNGVLGYPPDKDELKWDFRYWNNGLMYPQISCGKGASLSLSSIWALVCNRPG